MRRQLSLIQEQQKWGGGVTRWDVRGAADGPAGPASAVYVYQGYAGPDSACWCGTSACWFGLCRWGGGGLRSLSIPPPVMFVASLSDSRAGPGIAAVAHASKPPSPLSSRAPASCWGALRRQVRSPLLSLCAKSQQQRSPSSSSLPPIHLPPSL